MCVRASVWYCGFSVLVRVSHLDDGLSGKGFVGRVRGSENAGWAEGFFLFFS